MARRLPFLTMDHNFLMRLKMKTVLMTVPGLSEQLIIGAKTMQAWRFKLDFEADEVIIDPRVTRLRLL